MICIDRFEGNVAVLETDIGFQHVSRSQLPANVREGDLLVQTADGSYQVDAEATAARRAKLLARTKKLQKK